jgi:hypothetical protein
MYLHEDKETFKNIIDQTIIEKAEVEQTSHI